MSHKVIKDIPQVSRLYYQVIGKSPFSEVCELKGIIEQEEEDISPCSHFTHCERPSVIWIYDKDGSPLIYGLCNICYTFSYPTSDYWYRVVKISDAFKGEL